MLPDQFQGLATHMEWADAQVWSAVLATPQMHTDAFTRERLYHLHMVQRLYLQIWREKPVEIREASTFKELSEIQSWSRDYYVSVRKYLDSADAKMVDRRIEFPWAQHLVERFGEARPTTFLES